DHGGSAMDAVEAAIRLMEDNPLFNAGKGAVFTYDGKNELDASIMDGSNMKAGSVAGVRSVRHPISLARAVMEHSPHVMLIGEGAEAFARERDVEFAAPEYFHTEERWRQLQDALAGEAQGELQARGYFGTVGAVALDASGHLAAATSTGGMTGKRWGRVGDSPIIGAGTYANARCAVSCTGHGEFYIRACAAHAICMGVTELHQSLADAAEQVINREIPQLGGSGGAIALCADGTFAMPFNTEGMYRGWIDADDGCHVRIWRDD
ncbi:MAG TPA: isoaspartyl peptidase/L-asparaginase, partial [Rhodanobacteraceae bacterium]